MFPFPVVVIATAEQWGRVYSAAVADVAPFGWGPKQIVLHIRENLRECGYTISDALHSMWQHGQRVPNGLYIAAMPAILREALNNRLRIEDGADLLTQAEIQRENDRRARAFYSQRHMAKAALTNQRERVSA